MTLIDSRPQNVDILGYAGDTLSFYVWTSEDYSSYTWRGDVRLVHDETDTPVSADGSFTIGASENVSDPNHPLTPWRTPVQLDSDTTRNLAAQATSGIDPSYVKPGTDPETSLLTFSGIWDIQVEDASVPPVIKTLVQGTIKLDADVTRL